MEIAVDGEYSKTSVKPFQVNIRIEAKRVYEGSEVFN